MRAKNFFLAVVAGAVLCLSACALLLLSREDPFFVMSGIGEGETALFDNQRYQMAGLIRHQEYSQVVMGTSLAANYRASWFTEGTGEKTLKITFPDGWISEFDTALALAFRTHPGLDRVYFCLDPNILIRPDSQRTVELPGYLYNQNPLDDVEYLLNADTYGAALGNWMHRQSGTAVTLDEAYTWDKESVFSIKMALSCYPRPETCKEPVPGDAFIEAASENLDVVCGWAQAHPDVQFVVWFPPYSILYWDMMLREGKADAVLNAVEYASQRLMEQDNVTVHCFLHAIEVIINLNNYTDHIHCSGQVTAWEAQNLMDGLWRFQEDNYTLRLEELREYIKGVDYEKLLNS